MKYEVKDVEGGSGGVRRDVEMIVGKIGMYVAAAELR